MGREILPFKICISLMTPEVNSLYSHHPNRILHLENAYPLFVHVHVPTGFLVFVKLILSSLNTADSNHSSVIYIISIFSQAASCFGGSINSVLCPTKKYLMYVFKLINLFLYFCAALAALENL